MPTEQIHDEWRAGQGSRVAYISHGGWWRCERCGEVVVCVEAAPGETAWSMFAHLAMRHMGAAR